MKERIIITLIHGTFANQNEWTKSDSDFVVELKALLSDFYKEVEIKLFKWSGKNSHKERIRESEELNQYLENLRVGNADHYIVCHSHGSNVLNYSEKIFGIDTSKINGIITLGTPYLTLKKRALKKSRIFFLWAAPPLASFFTTLFLEDLFDYSNNVLSWFLFIAIGILTFIIIRLMFSWIKSYQVKKDEELSFIESQIPTLVIFHKKDEVLKLFDIQRKITNLPFAIWGKSFIGILLGVTALSLGFLSDFSLDDFLELMSDLIAVRDIGWVIIIFGICFLIFLATLGVLQLLMLFLPFIIIGHKFGFGKTSLLTNLLIQINAHPYLKWHPESFMIEDSLKGSLNHSVYNFKKVPGHIADWIKGLSKE